SKGFANLSALGSGRPRNSKSPCSNSVRGRGLPRFSSRNGVQKRNVRVLRSGRKRAARARLNPPRAEKGAKAQYSRREPPLFPFRPVENNRTISNMRQYGIFQMSLPKRAIRIHKEDVSSPSTPKCPDH